MSVASRERARKVSASMFVRFLHQKQSLHQNTTPASVHLQLGSEEIKVDGRRRKPRDGDKAISGALGKVGEVEFWQCASMQGTREGAPMRARFHAMWERSWREAAPCWRIDYGRKQQPDAGFDGYFEPPCWDIVSIWPVSNNDVLYKLEAEWSLHWNVSIAFRDLSRRLATHFDCEHGVSVVKVTRLMEAGILAKSVGNIKEYLLMQGAAAMVD